MQDQSFQPFGPTYSVSGSPVQALAVPNSPPVTSYRVSNLTAARAYITWVPPIASGLGPTLPAPVAPNLSGTTTSGVGMLATSVETFSGPAGAWFMGSAGSTFEVVPGEGQ